MLCVPKVISRNSAHSVNSGREKSLDSLLQLWGARNGASDFGPPSRYMLVPQSSLLGHLQGKRKRVGQFCKNDSCTNWYLLRGRWGSWRQRSGTVPFMKKLPNWGINFRYLDIKLFNWYLVYKYFKLWPPPRMSMVMILLGNHLSP